MNLSPQHIQAFEQHAEFAGHFIKLTTLLV